MDDDKPLDATGDPVAGPQPDDGLFWWRVPHLQGRTSGLTIFVPIRYGPISPFTRSISSMVAAHGLARKLPRV